MFVSSKYDKELNKKVKELRRKNGYTQEQLAEILDMKTSTYSQMERLGKIPINVLVRLSEVFKMELIDLLDSENNGEVANSISESEKGIVFDSSNPSVIGLSQPPTIIAEPQVERISLTNREENAIIMLRNLSYANREEVYGLIKELHDKKYKKKL